ncbi:MAG: 8-amino-7-oxononanoate synthase [Flavobacterium sp.]|nr:MAG: 8-amino-7-oxononanoate synthase [Flavobacterium sp.]
MANFGKKLHLRSLRYEIYDSAESLPANWDEIAAGNIFLSTGYLKVLDVSAPANMQCHYIAVHSDTELCGIAVSQFLDMSSIQSFGERDNRLKNKIRTFAFRNFSSNVLIIGNNMLTGQNTCRFLPDVDRQAVLPVLNDAMLAIERKLSKSGKKMHLFIWKDFPQTQIGVFNLPFFKSYFNFTTQPNMVFGIPDHWKNECDYVDALNKKYRDQYKRARKKSAGIIRRELSLDEIATFRKSIYDLYMTVASNAPFNTFYLSENHFLVMKWQLGENFIFCGYFLGDELVGFNTMIRNGRDIDTYFLGYSDSFQKTHMLYLNMLYDMIAFAIENRSGKIIFARTALEIKSSVGAEPETLHGLIRHSNPLINWLMPQLFSYFEPDVPWQQRHPFKLQ